MQKTTIASQDTKQHMDEIFQKYKSTSFNEQFNSPELKSHLGDVENSVFDIKNLIDEMIDAMKGTENIPVFLKESVSYYVREFMELFDDLYTIVHKPQVDHTSLDRSKTTFSNWHKQCILNQPFQNTPGFLDTYNTIKHFGRQGLREQDTEEAKSMSMQELSDKLLETEHAQREIRRIASKVSVSNYAQIFGEASKKFKNDSFIWLIIGGIAIFVLFVLALFVPWETLLPVESLSSYNISNIIIKSLLFGVVIFFISFSFKQYSANKHNSVVNQQRQTAMNSYMLFLESIDKNDKAERYNLMKFLAAAVYEHVNTGFISEKNQQPKSAIVELTKLMQPGSPD